MYICGYIHFAWVAVNVFTFALCIIMPIINVFGIPSCSDFISCLYRKDIVSRSTTLSIRNKIKNSLKWKILVRVTQSTYKIKLLPMLPTAEFHYRNFTIDICLNRSFLNIISSELKTFLMRYLAKIKALSGNILVLLINFNSKN